MSDSNEGRDFGGQGMNGDGPYGRRDYHQNGNNRNDSQMPNKRPRRDDNMGMGGGAGPRSRDHHQNPR